MHAIISHHQTAHLFIRFDICRKLGCQLGVINVWRTDLHSVPLEELQVHHRGNVKDEQNETWRCIHHSDLLHQLQKDQHHHELRHRAFVWEQGHAKGWLLAGCQMSDDLLPHVLLTLLRLRACFSNKPVCWVDNSQTRHFANKMICQLDYKIATWTNAFSWRDCQQSLVTCRWRQITLSVECLVSELQVISSELVCLQKV